MNRIDMLKLIKCLDGFINLLHTKVYAKYGNNTDGSLILMPDFNVMVDLI